MDTQITTETHIQTLMRSTKSSVQPYTLKDKTLYGKVVSVYDGDTFTVNLYQPEQQAIFQYATRCIGYDSPEMKPSKSLENRDELIGRAYQARDLMAEWLTNIPFYSNLHITSGKVPKNQLDKQIEELSQHILEFNCQGWDKYGRLLVSVPFNESMYWEERWGERPRDICEAMIKTGYGKAYDGGTKDGW
jgi:endonuclease YncB( thermonuclease family)